VLQAGVASCSGNVGLLVLQAGVAVAVAVVVM